MHPISLPALETLLTGINFKATPHDAGAILACLQFLSSYLCDESYDTAVDAQWNAMGKWRVMLLCEELSDNVKIMLDEVDIMPIIQTLFHESEIERRVGLHGHCLRSRLSTRVSRRPLELLGKAGICLDELKVGEMKQYLREHMGDEKVFIDDVCSPCVKEEENDGCPICCGGKDGLVKLNVCGHVFCGECIDEWVNGEGRGGTSKCPTCRTALNVTG